MDLSNKEMVTLKAACGCYCSHRIPPKEILNDNEIKVEITIKETKYWRIFRFTGETSKKGIRAFYEVDTIPKVDEDETVTETKIATVHPETSEPVLTAAHYVSGEAQAKWEN